VERFPAVVAPRAVVLIRRPAVEPLGHFPAVGIVVPVWEAPSLTPAAMLFVAVLVLQWIIGHRSVAAVGG